MPHHPWNHPKESLDTRHFGLEHIWQRALKSWGILRPSRNAEIGPTSAVQLKGVLLLYVFIIRSDGSVLRTFFSNEAISCFLVLALGGVLEIQGKILHHTPIAIEEGATLDTLYFQKYLHSTLPTVRS